VTKLRSDSEAEAGVDHFSQLGYGAALRRDLSGMRGTDLPPLPAHARAARGPTDSPQVRDPGDDPHRKPTDETAFPGIRRHGR
jgi:hypothetical protein